MTQVRYRPAVADTAAWRVAVEGSALAVLAPEVTDQTAEAVWRRVGDGGIGAVLEALTGAFGTSLRAIPPFALAVVEEGGVRVAVRGPVEVIVDDAEGTQAVSGEGVSTWTERYLPGAHRVTVLVGSTASDGPELPIRSGVVTASAVSITLDAAAAVAPPAAPVAAPVVEEKKDAGDAASVVASSESDIPSPAAPVPEEKTDAEDPIPVISSSESDISSNTAAIVTEIPAAVSADTWLPASTAAPEPPTDEYDLLWGETVARPITAAAVVVAEDPDAGSAPANTAAPATDASSDTPPADDRPAAPAPAASTPAEPAPGLAAAPTGAVFDPALGDHDGETVAVAEVRAMRAAERATFESTDGVPARRPARGRIVLSTGRIVELERPVVIGRRPKSTRTSGAELPTLVAVDSPEQDISRSHVEIRAEGEHVLATDLDTTNGTTLIRMGQDPVKLHPNEPTMVVAGDVLDLGDGILVSFEEIP